MDNATLIFMHIPKTAGGTLRHMLLRMMGEEHTFPIYGEQRAKTIELFKQLPDQQKRQLRFISGHIPFGIHDYVPQRCTYLTFLRNPVDRIISLYYYIRRATDHPLHERIEAQNLSLAAFIELEDVEEEMNAQVKYLCGIPYFYEGSATDNLLEIAQRNLQTHFVTGIAEEFDTSLAMMQRRFGWPQPYYRSVHVNPQRQLYDAIPDSVIQMIRERNQLDEALYNAAKIDFDETVRDCGGLAADVLKIRIASFSYKVYRTGLGLFRQ
jgi:hypothetical protein